MKIDQRISIYKNKMGAFPSRSPFTGDKKQNHEMSLLMQWSFLTITQ